MGGEHRGEARIGEGGLVGLEIAAGSQPLEDGAQRGLVRRGVEAADILAQPFGAAGEGFGRQAPDQRLHIRHADLIAVAEPRDGQRHREDWVAERILGGALARVGDQVDELALEPFGGLGRVWKRGRRTWLGSGRRGHRLGSVLVVAAPQQPYRACEANETAARVPNRASGGSV